MSDGIKVGVVGFIDESQFDKESAEAKIAEVFTDLKDKMALNDINIVSGLTNVGIPALAYAEAVKQGFTTTGIACSKAEEYECFPCDKKQIVGDQWGDESETFLSSIVILLKFGGGDQSVREFEEFDGIKFEYKI